ncbi:MAG: hypothetical protein QW327_00225 [Candidatus Odinarchaeota archaeon]
MVDSEDQAIWSKFNSLISKLEEVNIKLGEAANNIKNSLIPVFEKSMAEMQLSIDKLADKTAQMQTRFEQQTDFLIRNLMESITGIKTIFDVNKLEDILQKAQKVTETLGEELKKTNIANVLNELKTALNKLK